MKTSELVKNFKRDLCTSDPDGDLACVVLTTCTRVDEDDIEINIEYKAADQGDCALALMHAANIELRDLSKEEMACVRPVMEKLHGNLGVYLGNRLTNFAGRLLRQCADLIERRAINEALKNKFAEAPAFVLADGDLAVGALWLIGRASTHEAIHGRSIIADDYSKALLADLSERVDAALAERKSSADRESLSSGSDRASSTRRMEDWKRRVWDKTNMAE